MSVKITKPIQFKVDNDETDVTIKTIATEAVSTYESVRIGAIFFLILPLLLFPYIYKMKSKKTTKLLSVVACCFARKIYIMIKFQT